MQTFWDQHSLTVDVDELSAMALELFQRRADEFAVEEGAEVRGLQPRTLLLSKPADACAVFR